MLKATILTIFWTAPQVFFVGSDAKIDMRPSSVWLREKTAKWPWKTHLRVGAKRDEALEILSSEGTLLVLCSLVDNMPYVVAEAAVSPPYDIFFGFSFYLGT
jgi:hypothetical protein